MTIIILHALHPVINELIFLVSLGELFFFLKIFYYAGKEITEPPLSAFLIYQSIGCSSSTTRINMQCLPNTDIFVYLLKFKTLNHVKWWITGPKWQIETIYCYILSLFSWNTVLFAVHDTDTIFFIYIWDSFTILILFFTQI